MKKLITVLLAFVASLLLVLFAACESDTGGETTVVITASLSKTQANVGEEVTVEYSATGGVAVTVTYAKDGGAATPFTGNAFTASEAGTYVFTFTAEGAETVTRTLTVSQPSQPAPVISVTIDGDAVTSGSSVTKKVGERISAKVSVTNVAAGGYKILRYFNDIYLDDVTDSISEFENYIFRESDIGTICFECYIGEET